jgi:hypothetical protein
MYSYYLFSSLGIGKPVLAAVKPFITISQMTQFTIMMIHASYNMVSLYLLYVIEV